MKRVRSWIIGTAVSTLAAGAVVWSPAATLAQDGASRSFARERATHRMFGGAPLISIALKHRSELKLSDDQVADLEKVRTHYQNQIAPIQQQLQAVESEIAELRQQSPANLIQMKLKIEQAEKFRSELRYLREEALQQGKSMLTAQQQDQLKTLVGSKGRGFHKQQSQAS
jgi:Spy/CpxP family protein refolding chaperone